MRGAAVLIRQVWMINVSVAPSLTVELGSAASPSTGESSSLDVLYIAPCFARRAATARQGELQEQDGGVRERAEQLEW